MWYIFCWKRIYATVKMISFLICLSFPIILVLYEISRFQHFKAELEQRLYFSKDTPNKVIETEGKWIEVEETEGMIFYFSAYMDTDRVVVISFVKYSFTNRIRCRYYDRNGTPIPGLSDGYVHILFHYDKRWYRPSLTFCKLKNTNVLPHGVALVPDTTNSSINYVPIHYARNVNRNFIVCVSPMHSNFNNGEELVEMIELNRILGADFFIFYNQSSSQNIEGIIDHYQAEGLIQIVQWNLPGKVTFYDRIPTQEGGHYYGQVAVLNDCVYRNKGISRYVVNQDLDEFLIPRKLKTWHQLMADIPGGYGSYTFCSAVFPKNWPDVLSLSYEDTRDAIEFGSKTVLKQFRHKAFHHDQRTKWIVRPECIVACGIHDIWKTTANASCDNYNVMESKAIIHHYNHWKSIDSTKILDNRINGYKAELLQRLKNKWQILKILKQKKGH